MSVFIGIASATVFLIAVLTLPATSQEEDKVPQPHRLSGRLSRRILHVEEIEMVPPVVSGRLFDAKWEALIGPLIGIWLAQRTRKKELKNQRDYF